MRSSTCFSYNFWRTNDEMWVKLEAANSWSVAHQENDHWNRLKKLFFFGLLCDVNLLDSSTEIDVILLEGPINIATILIAI